MAEYYRIIDWDKFRKDAHPLLKEWFRKELIVSDFN